MKSALAWWETCEATGETSLKNAYLELLEESIQTSAGFLPGAAERPRVMDRLHACCYFLEAMYPVLQRADCAEAYRQTLGAIARYLRDIAPDFARSDVYAQLLRARVYGNGVEPVDTTAARCEATALTAFQARSEDPAIDGCFLFGRRDGALVPHANPVSTAFAIQALEVWRAFEAGEEHPCHLPPI
jgi:hypothetical protein